jgi:GNAT superfamily N-acetyltransferase
LLRYRPAEAKDWPFVLETFLDSYKHCHAAGLIQMNDWKEVMRPQLQKILDRPGCATWVAFNPAEAESGSDLYGWAAVERDYKIPTRKRVNGQWETSLELSEDPLVHYIFTKQAYRRLGIAKGLLRAAGVNVTEPFWFSAKTPVLDRLKAKIPQARWNPLLCRFEKCP